MLRCLRFFVSIGMSISGKEGTLVVPEESGFRCNVHQVLVHQQEAVGVRRTDSSGVCLWVEAGWGSSRCSVTEIEMGEDTLVLIK